MKFSSIMAHFFSFMKEIISRSGAIFCLEDRLSAIINTYIVWPSMRKPCIMCWKKVWVKATITNYNLWTIAPANLKSLTCVVMEIWAKINIPDCPYLSFVKKHCYVRCTRKSVYSPFMVNMWPCPPSQWASWLPKRSNESCSQRFDGKEQLEKKTSLSKDR